ncbi:MAG: alkyl hydroperoxide reductase subunit F [Muribaculaceae bacterium]
MLDNDIKQQLQSIFGTLKSQFTLQLVSDGNEEQTARVREFLDDVASTSPNIMVETVTGDVPYPTFGIVRDGEPTGISFCGIPNGHEFTTLLLALLNADGQGKNLPDPALTARIKALKGPIRLRTFVSLTCTNCPDVAQALNVIALLNPGVENTVIDGAVVPDIVGQLGIQSVPTAYAGDEVLSVGRSSLGDLLAKLEGIYGATDTAKEPVVYDYDLLVLGGGPAGAAAAIYSARKGFKTAVIAKSIGGQVKETMDIENLISVPTTTGPRLADDLRRHMESYPIDLFENRTIDSADIAGSEKSVTCANETFRARAVIIATGAGWRRLSVPGETEYLGHGVAFCTHCDGPFYAGKRVAVVGGGNSGIEGAIDLAGICPEVEVFEFMDALKADDVLQQRAASTGNIHIHTSSQVTEIVGDGKSVTGVKVKDRNTGVETLYPLSGVFVQIGLVANSAPFKGQLPMTPAGEIIVDERCRTAVKGVYAAGDVTVVPYKQIVIAMGEGAKAALSHFDDAVRGELG